MRSRLLWTMLAAAVTGAACEGTGSDSGVGAEQMELIRDSLPSGSENVRVVRGSLDRDELDEFVVTYEDSLDGAHVVILDDDFRRRYSSVVDHDESMWARLLDVDGDGILDVILTGPSRGGKSLQIIRSDGREFSIIGDFWGLEVKLLDEDGDGTMEVEVENRDLDRDPSRHAVHTFYRWDGEEYSAFKSYRATKSLVF